MAQDVERFTDSIFREEFSQMDQAQAEWEIRSVQTREFGLGILLLSEV